MGVMKWLKGLFVVAGIVSDVIEDPKCSICRSKVGDEHTLLCTRKGRVNYTECEEGK